MPIIQLTQSNNDYDLTAEQTVLSYSLGWNSLCYGTIKVGDGTKNANGAGGTWEVEVTVGGQGVQASPLTYDVPASKTRLALPIPAVYVPSGDTVVYKLTSPDASDTDVDVTAYLAADLDLAGYGGVTGSVVTNVGNSTTKVYTDLTEATDDHYNNRVLIFTSGDLKHQAVAIEDYDGTDKYLTVETMTEVASNGDTFVIM